MPWSPDGPTTPVVDRLGWTPDGPDDPTPVPEAWSVVVVGEAGGDLGRGVDTAAGRAFGTARDLGCGGDVATTAGVHARATDLGRGIDRAAGRASSIARDLGRGADTATGRMKGAASADLGRGLDIASGRALGAARDLGKGLDRAAPSKVLGTAKDLGRGADRATGRWLDAITWGTIGPGTVGISTWQNLVDHNFVGNTSGTVTITVTHTWGSNGLQWWPIYRRLRITIGGVQVGSYAEQQHQTGGWTTTTTWTGVPIAAGQVLAIQGWSESGYSQCRTVTLTSTTMTITAL